MHPTRPLFVIPLVLLWAGVALGQEKADKTLTIESSIISAHDAMTVYRKFVHRGMVWRVDLQDETFVVPDVLVRMETTSEKQTAMKIEKKSIKLTDAAGREYAMAGNLDRYGNFTNSTSNIYLYASAKYPAQRRTAPVFIVPKDAKKLTLHFGPARLAFDVPALSQEPQPDDAIKFEVTEAHFLDKPFELETRIHSSAKLPYTIEPAFGRWARISLRVSMPKPPRPGIKKLSVSTEDMAILCKGMVLGAAASERNGAYYPPISGSSLAGAGAEPVDAVFFVPVPEDAKEFELLYLNRKVGQGTISGGRPLKTPAIATPNIPAKIPDIPAEKTPPEKTRLEVKVVEVHVQDEIHAYPAAHVARGVRHRVREAGVKYVWFETAMIMHWGKDEVSRLGVKKEEFQMISEGGKVHAMIGDMEGGGDGDLSANSWSKSRPSKWQHEPTEVRRLAPLFAVPADLTKATLKIGAFEKEVTLPPVKPAIRPLDMASFEITGVEFEEPAPFETRLAGKTYPAIGVPTAGRWVKVSFKSEGLRPKSLGFDYYYYSTHEFGLWYDGVHRISVAQPFGQKSAVSATATMPIKGAEEFRPGAGRYYFLLPEGANGDIVLTYQLSPVAKGKIAAP